MKTSDIPAEEIGKEVKRRLGDMVSSQFRSIAILRAVADVMGLRVDEIVSSTKKEHIAIPRMFSAALCRKLTYLPLLEIAVLHGWADHTSARHAEKKFENSPELAKALAIIENKTENNE